MASIIKKIITATKNVLQVASKVVTTVVKYDPVKEATSFSFRYGTSLAVQQDGLHNNYVDKNITPPNATIINLENNLWINSAEKLAPNNLVIRQLALIDIFRNKPTNASRILKLMNILSYWNGTERVWAEGYSYFQYTFDILGHWIAKFLVQYGSVVIPVRNVVTYCNNGFKATAYKRSNVWYPAPFGDLRNVPLDGDLQIDHPIVTKTVGPVKIEIVGGNPKYTITAKPLGINLHIPVNNYSLTVVNGIPQGFTWYNGYDRKYPLATLEYVDMVNPKRLTSMTNLINGKQIV